VRRSPHVDRFAFVLRAPRCPRLIPVLCRGTWRAETPPFERLLPFYPRGPRSDPGSSVPVHPRLIGPMQAHPDFTALRLIPDAFAVHTAPRRPSSGSTLSLPVLLDMPSSTTPGRSQTGWFQTCGSHIGLRHVMSGSALPTVLQSASRRTDFSGLPGSLLLRPGKLLALCADLTRIYSGHQGFYLQASDESVTLLAAG
jgi:hypothetical protein